MENGLKPFIFISFNLNNCHWILVVVNSCCISESCISESAIGVLDPLAIICTGLETSVQRGYQIGLRLMQVKFGLTDVEQVNIRHIKQPDNSSCGVLLC